MSGIFDAGGSSAGGSSAAPSRTRRPPSRRPRALLPTLAIVVLLVVLGSVFVEIWTDKLWFESLGYSSVFTKVLWVRVALFAVFGLLLAAAVVGNVMVAFRSRPVFFEDSYSNPTVERYQDTIDPIRHWALVALGLVMALFGGASASGQWRTYLLWRNGVPFGQDDVYFGRDIGFFVFTYPWYRFLVSFGFTLVIITFIATAVTHYLYGGIRLQAPRDRVSSAAQVQLSILLGLFMLLKAVAYWLDRYGMAISDGDLITGITYTDDHAALPAKNILMVIAVICALLFFANVVRPGWMLPVLGMGLLVLSAILIGGIWPAIVQRFQVIPSEADKEAPYIQRNIDATRSAYDLNDVDIQPYEGETTDTPEQLRAAAQGLPGVRLIDPQLVSAAFEQLQQQRGFYQMPDVLDVDRYQIPGEAQPQDVVIAARELNLNGLLPSQRNWTNEHTVYTHGYGVVAAYGDERGIAGEPVWAQKNLPSTGQLGEFEQRIYYGETEPSYSIVGAPPGAAPVELNIPETSTEAATAGQANSTYDGEGGVPIGSTVSQLLYAAKFWNSSILLSGRVNSESKIIYDRSPRDMVQEVAPWLTVDGDAYPAVVDERLVWIIDGYTSTSKYPMSQLVDLSDVTDDSLTARQAVAGQQADEVNYIRNSVKATVDAYDGTVSLYAWDESDPMLRAWQGAFPGVVQPREAIPPNLLAHLRYPEDLFKVQRTVLSTYHITDPNTFYGGSENWLVPEDPTVRSAKQPPFYLTVKLPEGAPEFSLTSVYVPQSKQNLASFMAVNADATSENYGQFTVLQLPSNNAVSGPGQVANAMSNDPTVSGELLKYKQSGTTPQMGNLLTLPLDDELLYVQPVYTSRGSGVGSYPILQFVVLSIGDDVGIGTSFEAAFDQALGLTTEQPPVETPPPGNGGPGAGEGSNGPPGGPNETDEAKLTRYLANAQTAFEEAQEALDAGRLGEYQAANDEGLLWLGRAVELRQESAGTTTTTPPPGAGTPTPSGEGTTAPPGSGTPTPSDAGATTASGGG